MIHIKPFQSADTDAVLNLHNYSLQGTGAHLGAGPWDNDLKNILKVYQENGGAFLVGVLGDQIVAMGALQRLDTARAKIRRMRVLPEYQGQGYGEAMFVALESEARRLGYRHLCLDTTTLQVPAQRLYEKHGFRRVGVQQVHGLENILYEKMLEEGSSGGPNLGE